MQIDKFEAFVSLPLHKYVMKEVFNERMRDARTKFLMISVEHEYHTVIFLFSLSDILRN